METTPDRTFVNAPIDQELLEKLDIMVKNTESTRAQFIRLLIRKAWDEHAHLEVLKAKVKNGSKQIKQLKVTS